MSPYACNFPSHASLDLWVREMQMAGNFNCIKIPFMYVSLYEISIYTVFWWTSLTSNGVKDAWQIRRQETPKRTRLSDIFPSGVSFQMFLDLEGSGVAFCHHFPTSVTHGVYRVWHSLLKFFPQSVFISLWNRSRSLVNVEVQIWIFF